MADGLKVLDLKRPIREADISEGPGMGWTGRAPALRASMLVRGSRRSAMPCRSLTLQSRHWYRSLHRVRYRLMGQRTAIINQIRCFLLEHSITVRQCIHWLRHALANILAQRTDVLSPRMDWRRLDDRIVTSDRKIKPSAPRGQKAAYCEPVHVRYLSLTIVCGTCSPIVTFVMARLKHATASRNVRV
jgi:hypothetical protein